MKFRLTGAVKRLNVEHRTPNIERRILMTLRFIDFKKSEPQPATGSSVVSSESNDSPRRVRGLRLSKASESRFEGQIRSCSAGACAACRSVFSLNGQNSLFDVGRSMFDVRRSSVSSLIKLAAFQASGAAYMKLRQSGTVS